MSRTSIRTPSRLPGADCRHFVSGRCLREERLNPGLDREARCQVLLRLGEAFDRFLDRAEAFSLSEEQAGRAWEARFPEISRRHSDCRDCPPGGTDAFPDCPRLMGDLCLGRLPECEGRCRYFVRAVATPDAPNGPDARNGSGRPDPRNGPYEPDAPCVPNWPGRPDAPNGSVGPGGPDPTGSGGPGHPLVPLGPGRPADPDGGSGEGPDNGT